MKRFSSSEFFPLSIIIGIIATFGAPWVELRGTYAAWRIVEWHTFWRGEDAFQLASVVSSNNRVPIEYATADMQSTMQNLFALGNVLAMWHVGALIMLLAMGVRWRVRDGAKRIRVAIEIVALVMVNAAVLYLLTTLLALPSSMTPKVDFRTTEEIHTSSLIWSNVNVLLVAPVFSILAALAEIFFLGKRLRAPQPASKPTI